MCTCILVLAAEPPEITRYFCKVFYEEKANLQWQVMFTVVKNVEALREVLCHILYAYTIICYTTYCSILKDVILVLMKIRGLKYY